VTSPAGDGFKSHPPHSNFRHNLAVFWLEKPNWGFYEWGLKFEHTFTGKMLVFYDPGRFKYRFKIFGLRQYFSLFCEKISRITLKSYLNDFLSAVIRIKLLFTN
jgi:hypothetical protein